MSWQKYRLQTVGDTKSPFTNMVTISHSFDQFLPRGTVWGVVQTSYTTPTRENVHTYLCFVCYHMCEIYTHVTLRHQTLSRHWCEVTFPIDLRCEVLTWISSLLGVKFSSAGHGCQYTCTRNATVASILADYSKVQIFFLGNFSRVRTFFSPCRFFKSAEIILFLFFSLRIFQKCGNPPLGGQ